MKTCTVSITDCNKKGAEIQHQPLLFYSKFNFLASKYLEPKKQPAPQAKLIAKAVSSIP